MNTVKELVDAAGFDVVLDEIGAFAMECANIPNQSPACKEVFEHVAAEIAQCNRTVSRLLIDGMEYIDRAKVIANMSDFNLKEVLDSELEPGSEYDGKVAGAYTYELIPDHEVYRVLTKKEAYKEGIDLFGSNMCQQTDEYWVLTIH